MFLSKGSQDNLIFKAQLLPLDNAPGHPDSLGDLNEWENLTSTSKHNFLNGASEPRSYFSFKASYLKWTFRQVIDAAIGGCAFSVAEFWKKFNIQHPLENVQASRQEVTASSMCRMAGTFTPLCK